MLTYKYRAGIYKIIVALLTNAAYSESRRADSAGGAAKFLALSVGVTDAAILGGVGRVAKTVLELDHVEQAQDCK